MPVFSPTSGSDTAAAKGDALKPDAALRYLQQLATLGLPPQASIPEMLRVVERVIPAAYVTFYWIDEAGNMLDLCAPQVLIDAMQPVLIDYDRLDPVNEPTLDKLLTVGSSVDNSAVVHATHDFSRSFVMQEMTPKLGVGLGLDLVVRRNGRPAGVLFLNREVANNRFSAAETAMLERMHDQFAHALSAPPAANGAVEQEGVAAATTPDRQGVLIVDRNRSILSATRDALQILIELGGLLGMPSGARRAMLERLPPMFAALIDAVRRASSGAGGDVPAMLWRSPGGDYAARGFAQHRLGVSAAGDGVVTVLLSHHLPRAIALFRRVAAMNLAPRERQIAFRLGEGMPPDAIANLLGITPQTLRGYLKSIYAKTGSNGQLDLYRRLN